VLAILDRSLLLISAGQLGEPKVLQPTFVKSSSNLVVSKGNRVNFWSVYRILDSLLVVVWILVSVCFFPSPVRSGWSATTVPKVGMGYVNFLNYVTAEETESLK
jgi:hypothetical protein